MKWKVGGEGGKKEGRVSLKEGKRKGWRVGKWRRWGLEKIYKKSIPEVHCVLGLFPWRWCTLAKGGGASCGHVKTHASSICWDNEAHHRSKGTITEDVRCQLSDNTNVQIQISGQEITEQIILIKVVQADTFVRGEPVNILRHRFDSFRKSWQFTAIAE